MIVSGGCRCGPRNWLTWRGNSVGLESLSACLQPQLSARENSRQEAQSNCLNCRLSG